MSDSPISVGLVIFDKVEELDFVGPWEVLTMGARSLKLPIEVWLIAKSRDVVTCAKGMRVLPDVGFADCPPFDILMVPGGQGAREGVHDAELVGFIAERGKTARWVTSICTGSGLLGAAGLIGKR
jgi:putative intracellular protease/amidase